MQDPENKPPELDPKPNTPNRYQKFLWDFRLEILAGALMLIGIILSFFYTHIGGSLVGLGAGICFFEELRIYLTTLRDFYTERGLFKTLMFIGVIIYFLIAIPAFIIAAAIAFGGMYLIRHFLEKP